MATLEQLETALVNADKAGDTAAATVLAKEIRNMRLIEGTGVGESYRPRTSIDPEKPSPLVSAGRGFLDLGQGTKQIYLDATDPAGAKDYTKQTDADIALYEKGRGPNAGFDAGRFAGNVLGSAPVAAALTAVAPEAAVATLGGRMALGGVQGAMQGATAYTPEGGSKTKQVLLGTAGGVAGTPVGEILSRVVAKIAQAGRSAATRLTTSSDDIVNAIQGELRQAGVDWNSLGAEVKATLVNQARRQLSVQGSLSPEMLARKLEADDVLGPGAGLTQGQVTRNPQQWTWERNNQKMPGDIGQPLTERYQAQIQRLEQRLNDAVTQTQAKAQNQHQAGEAATQAVQQKMDESKKLVDDMYAVWRETGAGVTEVKPQGIADALGKVVDEIGLENVPPAVRARLESFGMAGGKQTKLLTIDEAEKLRRLIGNNDPGHGPASLASQRLKQAVDRSVMETDAPDIPSLKAARDAARSRFEMRDSGAGVTAAANDAEPDKFFRKFVLNGNVRDLQGLKQTLNTTVTGQKIPEGFDAQPLGSQAWKDLQGQTLQHIMDKATTGPNGFSGKAMDRALKELGDERLKVIFAPEQVVQLKKLARVANDVTTEPAFSSVNRSNTAPTLMQYGGDVLKKIASIPGVNLVGLPLLGAGEMGVQSLKDQALRRRVASTLNGTPADPTMASDRYAKLVQMLSGRMDPAAGAAGVGGTLFLTQ